MVKHDKPEALKPKIEDKDTVPNVVKVREKHVPDGTNNNKTREVLMPAKGGANIQDQFLNHMRREKTPVAVHLLDGKDIHGLIKSFDNFCIQLEPNPNGETLIYKHGISSITPAKGSDRTK